MSIQNGRPGSPIGYTGPIIGYGGVSQHMHPLASPKTQHITAASPVPSSPGSATYVDIFQTTQAPVQFGAAPQFVAGRISSARQ